MARPANKNPKSAIEKLLYDYNLNGNEIVSEGYFSQPSSIYEAMKKDVRDLRLNTILSISMAIHVNPGETVNKLLELQKTYPPKKPMKL